MNSSPNRPDALWSIVLAGGDGQRTRPFITRWLGNPKPKQYCVFSGERSLFQQTLDRAERLTPSKRRVTVAAAWHRSEVLKQVHGREEGRVVFQPVNRGTAPGVFLPLSYVKAADPSATVALFPSDHFVHPEDAFAESIRCAVRAVDHLPRQVILLGAVPDCLEQDYGWIEPGRATVWDSRWGVRPVRRFVEKPSLDEARATMAVGGLWNTFVVVSRLSTLWELGWAHLPEMMPLFESLSRTVGTSREPEMLETIYRDMPHLDFSADLLQRIPARLGVVEMTEVIWSDWGRPERIAETLERVGQTPAFPVEALAAA